MPWKDDCLLAPVRKLVHVTQRQSSSNSCFMTSEQASCTIISDLTNSKWFYQVGFLQCLSVWDRACSRHQPTNHWPIWKIQSFYEGHVLFPAIQRMVKIYNIYSHMTRNEPLSWKPVHFSLDLPRMSGQFRDKLAISWHSPNFINFRRVLGARVTNGYTHHYSS